MLRPCDRRAAVISAKHACCPGRDIGCIAVLKVELDRDIALIPDNHFTACATLRNGKSIWCCHTWVKCRNNLHGYPLLWKKRILSRKVILPAINIVRLSMNRSEEHTSE